MYKRQVYGSVNGILGILNNHLLNLTEIMNENPAYLDRLETTPAMYLGSCRHKLPDYLDDDSSYVFIFKQFELYNVGAFFYIGGNDSMDTVLKLSEYGKKIGSDVRIIGIPKTIDNDLCETDHTPGFGSAAKYICLLYTSLFLQDFLLTKKLHAPVSATPISVLDTLSYYNMANLFSLLIVMRKTTGI